MKETTTNKILETMKTFNTPTSKDFKPKSSFDIKKDSIEQRLDQMIEQGKGKYEIAMELPELLKMKEGIEENLTRHYIRKRFVN